MIQRLKRWFAEHLRRQQELEDRRNAIEDWIDGLGEHPDA